MLSSIHWPTVIATIVIIIVLGAVLRHLAG